MKSREVNREIESRGGEILRQRGSHRIYRATVHGVTVQTVVPQHTGDIPNGTFRSIEKSMEPAFGKGWLT